MPGAELVSISVFVLLGSVEGDFMLVQDHIEVLLPWTSNVKRNTGEDIKKLL